MNNNTLIKIGLIQAISFLLYIIGVFVATLFEVEDPLSYFVIGLVMIFSMIVSGVYLVFYFMRDKE